MLDQENQPSKTTEENVAPKEEPEVKETEIDKKFDAFKRGKGLETWEAQLKESFNLSFFDLQKELGVWISGNADKISRDIMNIAPYGDYGKLIEDASEISKFVQEDCSKPETWKLIGAKKVKLYEPDNKKNIDFECLQFCFTCEAVDEGDYLLGSVYVNEFGKVKHTFAYIED